MTFGLPRSILCETKAQHASAGQNLGSRLGTTAAGCNEWLLPILFASIDRKVKSMAYGRGTRVEYDFGAVERAIRHRFVAGKPRVQVRGPACIMMNARSAESFSDQL